MRILESSYWTKIGIRNGTTYVIKMKKCEFHMVYKKDIEGNTSITPYEDLDDRAGLSGEGSSNDIPNPKRLKGS